jgi:hypothetical protein
MPGEVNGMFWHVAFAGSVGQDLKTLFRRAKEVGLGDAYIDAIKFALQRLRQDPLALGELIERRPKSRLLIHVRIVKPLLFEFAIHEETHNVLIQRVQLML